MKRPRTLLRGGAQEQGRSGRHKSPPRQQVVAITSVPNRGWVHFTVIRTPARKVRGAGAWGTRGAWEARGAGDARGARGPGGSPLSCPAHLAPTLGADPGAAMTPTAAAEREAAAPVRVRAESERLAFRRGKAGLQRPQRRRRLERSAARSQPQRAAPAARASPSGLGRFPLGRRVGGHANLLTQLFQDLNIIDVLYILT